jgi:two-component system response regulator
MKPIEPSQPQTPPDGGRSRAGEGEPYPGAPAPTLRLARTNGQSEHADAGQQKVPAAPITILLVDDDDDCRLLVRDAIGECDAPNRVVEVGDGQQALDYLRSAAVEGSKPGLIFLDIEMPRMNGLETLRRIKADPMLKDIPVVMLTGVAEDEHMRRAAEYGANSYTIKPSDAQNFLQTVMSSCTYWLRTHQFPDRHLPQDQARR